MHLRSLTVRDLIVDAISNYFDIALKKELCTFPFKAMLLLSSSASKFMLIFTPTFSLLFYENHFIFLLVLFIVNVFNFFFSLALIWSCRSFGRISLIACLSFFLPLSLLLSLSLFSPSDFVIPSHVVSTVRKPMFLMLKNSCDRYRIRHSDAMRFSWML